MSWWRGKDSNLRRLSRQIYSLIPLTAREPRQLNLCLLELSDPFRLQSCKYKAARSPTANNQRTGKIFSKSNHLHCFLTFENGPSLFLRTLSPKLDSNRLLVNATLTRPHFWRRQTLVRRNRGAETIQAASPNVKALTPGNTHANWCRHEESNPGPSHYK